MKTGERRDADKQELDFVGRGGSAYQQGKSCRTGGDETKTHKSADCIGMVRGKLRCTWHTARLRPSMISQNVVHIRLIQSY